MKCNDLFKAGENGVFDVELWEDSETVKCGLYIYTQIGDEGVVRYNGELYKLEQRAGSMSFILGEKV